MKTHIPIAVIATMEIATPLNHGPDPARNLLQKPIIVNSGYRCPRLNSMVGGVKRSYHLSGRAADITTGNIDDNRRLMEILSQLPHVELISEHGGLWIHVAF